MKRGTNRVKETLKGQDDEEVSSRYSFPMINYPLWEFCVVPVNDHDRDEQVASSEIKSENIL